LDSRTKKSSEAVVLIGSKKGGGWPNWWEGWRNKNKSRGNNGMNGTKRWTARRLSNKKKIA